MIEKTRATTTNIGLLDQRYLQPTDTMFIGTTEHALNRASATEGLTGITSLTPTTDFTLIQNGVPVLTSIESGAVANTIYLKEGNFGIGTTTPAAPFHIHRTGAVDELFRFTSYGSSIPSITMGTGEDAPGVGIINLWRAASGVITVKLTGSLTNDSYFNGSNVAIGATSAGGYKLNVTGTLIASDYYSGDGTQGATATATGLVFKDGLYTSGTVDFTGLVTTSQATPQTIGDTSNRLLKLWATDIEVTNPIEGSITGSASTLTTTRTLWGQNFNGGANVSGALTGVGDITTGNNPTFSWGSNTLSLRSTNSIGVVAIKGSTINDYAPRLDIYEGTSATVNISLSGDGDSYFNGGDFGIGNTNPAHKLHVTGNAYVTGAMGIGTTPSASADLRINSTATHESSLYAGIWQSVSYNPVGTPVAGTNVRGLLFQVSTPAVADDLSNVILYGALGQVTHGGSGALGQAIGMNPGVFLTGSGNVATSAGITLSATASGGGAHTTFYGFRTGGITLSGGSTMVSSYAFYADAVTGATTNNYAFYSNGGLVHFGDSVDLTSGKTLTMPVGSIITDTTTGLKIGTATTQKIGFYNVTPVVQASAYTQTYSTASKTVPAATASNPPAGGTGATAGAYDTAANRNAMITSLTNNIADVLALKKVVNALIDDLQAIGIIS